VRIYYWEKYIVSKSKCGRVVRLLSQVIAANVGIRHEMACVRKMLEQGEEDRRNESLACTEIAALRSEMAQWDGVCNSTIAYLLSATFVYWTAVTTVVSQGKTEEWALLLTVLNLSVTCVWLIGHRNVFEKRFMIRRIAFYIRTELERRIFDGRGWESYIVKNRKWLDETFARLPPIETECRIIFFAVVANAISLVLYLDFSWDLASAWWGLSVVAGAVCFFVGVTVFGVIKRFIHYRSAIGRRLSGVVQDARKACVPPFIVEAIPDLSHVGAHAATTVTDQWGRYCLELTAFSGPAKRMVNWNVHVFEARGDRNPELRFHFLPEGEIGRIGNRMRSVSATQTIETTGATSRILSVMAALTRMFLPRFGGDGWVALDLVVHPTSASGLVSSASGVGAPSGSNQAANP
jgi:hypothetical protein